MTTTQRQDQQLKSWTKSLLPKKHQTRRQKRRRIQAILLLPTLALLSFPNLFSYLHTSLLRRLCTKTPYVTVSQAQSMTPISPYDGVDDDRTPSHIQMCKAYLARKDSPPGTFFEKTIVMEDDDVCRNWDAPHYFLMRMFASSLVGMASENDQLEYRHDCQYTRIDDNEDPRVSYDDFDVTTVQQILAQADLLFRNSETGEGLLSETGEGLLPTVTKDVVASLCRGCLVHYDASKRPRPDADMYSRMTHECLLYPGVGTLDALKNAVGLTEQEASRSMVPLNAMIPIITKLLRHAALDWSRKTGGEGDVPQKERESGVVIYIDESSTMMSASVFAKYVSQGATSIAVLVSPLCARTANAVCYKEASKLATFLDNLFPLADVQIDIVSSTATAYSRMIRAKHLLCHPGSVSCLFPALTKDENTYAIVGVSPLREGTYGWFDELESDSERMEVLELQKEETTLDVDISYDDSNDDRNNDVYSTSSYYNRPMMLNTGEYGTWMGGQGHVYSGHHTVTGGAFGTRKDCTQIRGKMGSWDRGDYDLDWDYDALIENGGTADLFGTASLDLNLNSGESRVSSSSSTAAAGRGKGTYQWNEDAFANCKFDMLNLDGLCEVVHSMDLSRIFFVGDQLQSSMVSSFWNLLQNNQRDYISESIIQNDPSNVWSKTLNCLKHGRHFELAFTRNDRLSTSPYPMLQPSRLNSPFGNVQCNPWVDYYNSNPRRTLVVASPGTTAYDGDRKLDEFQSDFDEFTKTVRSFEDRPDDLVLVRTAAPSFAHCDDDDHHVELPVTDLDMVQFNAYAHRVVDEFEWKRRKQQQLQQQQQQLSSAFPQAHYQQGEQYYSSSSSSSSSYPPIHMLDVAPMTFAHPEHHGRRRQEEMGALSSSSSSSCTEESKQEKLNLMNWWNHMLYNHLIDMAMKEKEGWTCDSC